MKIFNIFSTDKYIPLSPRVDEQGALAVLGVTVSLNDLAPGRNPKVVTTQRASQKLSYSLGIKQCDHQ